MYSYQKYIVGPYLKNSFGVRLYITIFDQLFKLKLRIYYVNSPCLFSETHGTSRLNQKSILKKVLLSVVNILFKL